MSLIQPADFRAIFINDLALLDVRAEVEFNQGSFPGTVNVPILNDAERDLVGRCYKQRGPDAAIALGHQLVRGEIKQQRIQAWINFCKRHPQGALYCFRGGMRSALTQQWLREAGINYPRIAGGYKALRHFLMDEISHFASDKKMIVVAGRTGTGKTRVIQAIDCALDLEKYAHHRGSAFGQLPGGQPSQINFENTLAIAILKKCQRYLDPDSFFAVEDESRLIGKNALPIHFKNSMSESPVVRVEESIESRIEVVIEEYVIQLSQMYLNENPVNGWQYYCDYMLHSVHRIKKRLGGVLSSKISAQMQQAFISQSKNNDLTQHEYWIKPLLHEYYDKMYDYQLRKKNQKILFQGNRTEVIQYMSEMVEGSH